MSLFTVGLLTLIPFMIFKSYTEIWLWRQKENTPIYLQFTKLWQFTTSRFCSCEILNAIWFTSPIVLLCLVKVRFGHLKVQILPQKLMLLEKKTNSNMFLALLRNFENYS